MPNIGPLEIIVVLIIVLVIFGPKRLPELGRSLGRGMREFKESVTGKDEPERPPAPEIRAGKAHELDGTVADEADRQPAAAEPPARPAGHRSDDA